MDDEAWPVPEDGVELVLAGRREALVAALLEADELLVTEVPAARPLIQVPADGALFADLRCADLDRGHRERRIELGDLRVLRDIGDPHRRADLQAATGRRRHRGIERSLDVDHG